MWMIGQKSVNISVEALKYAYKKLNFKHGNTL